MASGGAPASNSGGGGGGGSTKTVTASLWWDPFVALSDDLDYAAASPSATIPDALAERIKGHHAWLRGGVSFFGKPNEASRSALDGGQVAAGAHRLAIKTDLKEAALRLSKCLNLDEVQSYILVKRCSESTPMTLDANAEEFLRLVSVQYYLERQCLLKCIRRIFVHANDASGSTDAIKEEASLLINEEMERRLLSIIEDSLAAAVSLKPAADSTVSWLEETLIEINLILDILFLAFYDNFSRCNGALWITLCSIFKDMLAGSYDVRKFAVSVEAQKSFHYAKAQLLLILIETLDFENLLRMVHDDVSLSGGYSTYSVSDILEMDVEVSKLPEFAVESGPLILAWAVFLCLVLSLPASNANLEIDHTSYAQRAFEFAPFNYLLGVLCSSTFKESDGPVSGYRGVLRTFISAFIASYEISYQTEDSSLDMILNILCEIYSGEESLCMQFWDKDSFVDGPIRSILHMVEKNYPFQISDLIRFLSAACHGAWPAQCVYNYLERMNGVTTLYAIPSSVSDGANYCDHIEIHHGVRIPGMEGITIPRGTRGYILKVLEDDVALVRWEFPHSGIFILLVTLAQDLYSCNYAEACDIMDLLYQMVSSNKDLCLTLLQADKLLAVQKSKNLGQIEEHVRIDMVKIFCTSIFKYVQDGSNASIMSKTLGLLTEILKCVPHHAFAVALECGIFTSQSNGSSSDWLLSGALARMLLASSENGDCSSLATSLLDFAIQVLRQGAAADDLISPFIVFSIQYIMVNHMNWKYKKYSRWKTTLQVLELVKRCIQVKSSLSKLGGIIWQILLHDSSIYSVLWHIVCTSTQLLESHGSNFNGLVDTEDIQLVLCCALEIIFYMLSNLPEELLPVPPFVTMVLSSSSKPFPFVRVAISLMSFHNPAIQVAAARTFSVLCSTAYKTQPQFLDIGSFIVGDSEIWRLQTSISHILDKKENTNNQLIVAIFNLVTSVARYQPALFVSLTEQHTRIRADPVGSANSQVNGFSVLDSSESPSRLAEQTLSYIVKSMDLMNRSPSLLLSILDLLKALWESGVQFISILDKLRSSRTFWDNLSRCICASFDGSPVDNADIVDEILSLRYNCQGKIFDIMSHELFLKGRLLVEAKTSNPVPTSTAEQNEPSGAPCPSNIVLQWFDSAIMEDCITHLASNGYQKELIHQAKVASCVCIICLIMKLSAGDTGSLSFSVVKKMQLISNKLLQHRAFLALVSEYALQGYSGEQEVTNLVINDLYYHIHGELEGRQITPGPFQELLCFLLEFRFFERSPLEQPYNTSFPGANDNFLFDIPNIRDELGVELWNHSAWKTDKEVAEKMLDVMHKANLMKFYADAKLCTLRSFITFVSVYIGTCSSNKFALPDGGISARTTQSAVRCACKSFQSTVDLLLPEVDTNEILFPLLSGQVELLLTLARFLFYQAKQTKSSSHLFPVIVLLMKTSCAGTSFLVDIMPSSPALKKPVKSLLVLLLSLFEFIYGKDEKKDDSGDVNLFGQSSLMSLLPVLCKLSENREYSDLAVGSMDLILKGFLPPHVWVPILQKHFHLQAILHKYQSGALLSTQVMLNFFLTMGRTRDGAKILQSANIFAFLKVLLSQLSLDDSSLRNSLSTQAKDVNIWGLSLAIVTSLNHCTDDDIPHNNVTNNTISFLSGQVPLISSYLCAQSVNTHQSKKRALLQQSQTSLSALILIENILTLLCILAKYHFPRDIGIMEVDSELREIIIHLLAFISRGSARTGTNWNPSFCCPPILKEELMLHEDPPLIRSKYGWFRFAASSTMSAAAVSAPNAAFSLVIRDTSSGDSDSVKQTRFTEVVAVQIYRIAFLIMKFLCSQAKEAVKRAEELEFLDLAHFPELPMPDILHGLQDQVVFIVTEVLEANGSSTLDGELHRVCHLLLVILDTSLYMELCVSQSCGIRPVMGRFEDFSKGIKSMLYALEKHSSLKPLVTSLNQITNLLYPGLAQSSILM